MNIIYSLRNNQPPCHPERSGTDIENQAIKSKSPRSRTPKGRRQAGSRHTRKASFQIASRPQIGCEAAPCKEFAPSARNKNFPREHPPQTKRIKSSLCIGGYSWGKFSVSEGGLEGESPIFQEGALSLQGLPSSPPKIFPSPLDRTGRMV